MDIDEVKLERFMAQVVADMAAAESATLMYLGDKLGLYRAMSGAGPLTSNELAERSGTHERYVREWLANQTAGGYVTYDPEAGTYELPLEHAVALADEDSPVFVAGLLDIVAAMWAGTERISDAFRSGAGVGWHEHDPRLYRGVERLFRPLYRANLTTQWIPALDGVEAKLKQGARVADVGCGHGASTVVMAEAYPGSTFVGFDSHPESIEAATKAAAEAGVADRVTFQVANAADYPGSYDLICFFDCLHDMGDPVGAAAHARDALADGGCVVLVEPQAGDGLEDNINPVSRLYYAGSTFLCTPSALSQEVRLALGGQAGEARLAAVMTEAGFSSFRRVAETPFNLVFEARP
ncbi:MAG: class I SAM-dependent methyltransferase [Actinomycetota bacterium]|nr:class I SAM-dependent methyltransferase [Actinomycetota bacterium]